MYVIKNSFGAGKVVEYWGSNSNIFLTRRYSKSANIHQGCVSSFLVHPPERWRSIVMSTSLCHCVCLSVCEYISRTTCTIFTNFCVHVAYGRGSVLLWQGDEIPRGRGNFGGCLGHSKALSVFAFSALTLLVGQQEDHLACKTEWWGTGVVTCLERHANNLHMVQLMPLPPHHHLHQ